MKNLTIWFMRVLGLVVIFTSGSPVAVSSDYERQWEDDDHAYDRARRAVNRGEALPIATLLEKLTTRVPGEVVGVKFEREHGRWIYEFKVIDIEGRLLEVYVDAHSGEVLSMEED